MVNYIHFKYDTTINPTVYLRSILDSKAVAPYAVKIVEESHAREADNVCEEKLLECTGDNFAS